MNRVGWMLLCGLAAGCTDAASGNADRPDGSPDGPVAGGEEPPRSAQCEQPSAAATPLSMLTAVQYDRTVESLLGLSAGARELFPPAARPSGFETSSALSSLLAERQLVLAERLAEQAVEDLDALLACDRAEQGDDACASRFIEDFGLRAYRRPLTDAERARFEALYADGKSTFDFATGIRMVVQAALSSPGFLYHLVEQPPDARPGDLVQVRGYSMASRLSYFLWNDMPDRELFDAAQAGELDAAAGVAAQAERMSEEPRAREGFENFYRQWLLLDGLDRLQKDPTLFPEFDADMAADLRRSIEAFMDASVWEQDGTLDAVLLSDFAFVNERLAPLYGDSDVHGSALERIAVDPERRSGLLTQPALMALFAKRNQTDPVHRGEFVREQLFCQQLPPPPDNIMVVLPEPEPGVTTRERFAEHASNPLCSDCHELMDPIGFGFEHYDAVGRYRTEDQGLPVQAAGQVIGTLDADGSFEGAVELSERLAASLDVRRCVARQVTRYAIGRTEHADDRCSIETLEEAFLDSEGNIRDLLVAVTASDAFRHRRIPTEER